MDGLVAWCLAQLDEDERKASARKTSLADGELDPITDEDVDYWATYAEHTGLGEAEAEHIRNWLPSRVLAEVDAKRRIVDECAEILAMSSHYSTVESCDEADVILAEHVVRNLAASLADRDGYREEWRP